MFLILLVNALFSLTYIIISYALQFGHPLHLLTYRMLFSGISLILFQYIYNHQALLIKKKDILYLFLTCLLHMYINFLSETYALQKIAPIMVSIFYLMTPIFSSFLDYIYTHNKLSIKQIVIIGIGTLLSIGMIVINTENNITYDSHFYQYILLLISIMASTLAWYRINYIISKENYSLITINGYASFLAGILFFITSFYCNIPFQATSQSFILLLSGISLGAISNIIGYNLYSILLKKYNLTTILFSELLSPCFTAYYQWFFFHIPPQINHFIFFILFVICVISFNYYENNKKHNMISQQ